MQALSQKENGGFAWIFDELYISQGITKARRRKHTNIDIKYSSLFVLQLPGAFYFKSVRDPVKWQWCGSETQWCPPLCGSTLRTVSTRERFQNNNVSNMDTNNSFGGKEASGRRFTWGILQQPSNSSCWICVSFWNANWLCVCSEMKIHWVSCKIGDWKSRNLKLLISVEMQTGVYYKIW